MTVGGRLFPDSDFDDFVYFLDRHAVHFVCVQVADDLYYM